MHPSLPQQLPAWLADVSLQVTAILGLAWLVLKVYRRNSAAQRCLIAGATIAAVPGVMLVSILFPDWRLIQVATPPPAVEAKWELPATPPATITKTNSAPIQLHTQDRVPAPAAHWTASQWFIATWLMGIGGVSIAFLISAARLRRMAAKAQQTKDPFLVNELTKLAGEAGLNPERIRLLTAKESRVPMTWGLIGTNILLPSESTEWPQARVVLVLRHELAHVSRHDTWWTLAVHLSAMLLWFHPGVWAMLRIFATERETACDDLALQRGGQDPVTFAEDLLDAIGACSHGARPILPLALCMAEGDKTAVKARLAAVLDTSRDRSACTSSHCLVTAIFAIALTVVVGGLSACRPGSSGTAATQSPTGDTAQRIYFLTDIQWQKLTEGLEKRTPPAPPTDPFAPAPKQPRLPQPSSAPTELTAATIRIRTHLVEAGIPLSTISEDNEVVRLKDERTLIVTGPADIQDQVAKYLSTLVTDPMVRIDMQVIQLPMTWPTESLGLVFDKGGTLRQTTLTQKATEELLAHLKAIPGASLQGMPSSTFRSGQRSSIEMVREFIYPTEFDPPELTNVAAKPEADREAPGAFPVTPTTPTAFEMRPIGVRAEFEAKQLSPGMIQVDIAPEVTVLEGFVNYGSPIRTTGRDIIGTPVAINLTDNKIDQPIFHTAKFTSSMVIKTGESVIIGGLATPNHELWQEKKSSGSTGPSAPGVTMDQELAVRLNSTPERMVFFIISATTSTP